MRSIAPFLTAILQLFKGLARVQALKPYLASVELGLVPLLGIIINKLPNATDDIINSTLYCLESLAKYISLSHSAEEGEFGHFEEYDSCNILLAILRVCNDHIQYDNDQQTRAYNVLKSFAAGNAENCAFMLQQMDLSEDNRFFRGDARTSGISKSREGLERLHLYRTSKNRPVESGEEVSKRVAWKCGQIGSIEKYLLDIKAPVSDSVSTVSVIASFSSVLQAFITHKLTRSMKSTMFYVFDVLMIMASCEDVSVGEGIFLSPITNLLIAIINFAPSSEQGAKGMNLLSGLSENPWVRFRMLQLDEGLMITNMCIRVIRLGNVAGRNAALQVLISLTVAISANGLSHPTKFTNLCEILQTAEEDNNVSITIDSSSKALARRLLRNESGFLMTVIMTMRSKHEVIPLAIQDNGPHMDDDGSVNQITLERCCTLLTYFSSAILVGLCPEGYELHANGVLGMLEAEVKRHQSYEMALDFWPRSRPKQDLY